MIWVILILLYFYFNIIVTAEICLLDIKIAARNPEIKSHRFTLDKFIEIACVGILFGGFMFILAMTGVILEKAADIFEKTKQVQIKL